MRVRINYGRDFCGSEGCDICFRDAVRLGIEIENHYVNVLESWQGIKNSAWFFILYDLAIAEDRLRQEEQTRQLADPIGFCVRAKFHTWTHIRQTWILDALMIIAHGDNKLWEMMKVSNRRASIRHLESGKFVISEILKTETTRRVTKETLLDRVILQEVVYR